MPAEQTPHKILCVVRLQFPVVGQEFGRLVKLKDRTEAAQHIFRNVPGESITAGATRFAGAEGYQTKKERLVGHKGVALQLDGNVRQWSAIGRHQGVKAVVHAVLDIELAARSTPPPDRAIGSQKRAIANVTNSRA